MFGPNANRNLQLVCVLETLPDSNAAGNNIERMESHVRVTHTDTHIYTAHSQWPWPMGPKYSEK